MSGYNSRKLPHGAGKIRQDTKELDKAMNALKRKGAFDQKEKKLGEKEKIN